MRTCNLRSSKNHVYSHTSLLDKPYRYRAESDVQSRFREDIFSFSLRYAILRECACD